MYWIIVLGVRYPVRTGLMVVVQGIGMGIRVVVILVQTAIVCVIELLQRVSSVILYYNLVFSVPLLMNL
jgi:hypothetical protein